MIYLTLFIILLLLLTIIFIPLKIKIFVNLEAYEFKIYNLKIYQKKFLEIKDIKKERTRIKYLKIFKVIDIQSVNLDIGGLTDYFYRAINYGAMHIIFNLFSFIIRDQFRFNYNLDFNSKPKLNFQCIIKSNVGKIIIGLLKRRS